MTRVVHQPALTWRFQHLLLLLLLLLSFILLAHQQAEEEFLDIFLEYRNGKDSPSCSSLLHPCMSIGYALDLLSSSNNTNIRINLLDDYVPCDWKFKNSNITKLLITSSNKRSFSCSIGVEATIVPFVRFQNLNLRLSGVFKGSELEVVDCLLYYFYAIYNGSLTLDNVTVGSEFILNALQQSTVLTSSETIEKWGTKIHINSGAIEKREGKILIRNSRFMGVAMSALYYWDGNLQIENCSFDYSLIQFESGQIYATGNNDLGRPDFVVSRSNFSKSSFQFVEAKSVTISNSLFTNNLPTHIGKVFAIFSAKTEYPALYLSSLSILNVKIDESKFTGCDIVGALYLEGVGIYANIQNTIFSGNSNRRGGSAITVKDIYKLHVRATLFENNNQLFESNNLKPDEGVGGGSIFQYQSMLQVVRCYFFNNSALIGGAIFSQYAKQFQSSSNVSITKF